jgi:ribosomal protein S18 acetylase RimI-like enzyme
MTLTEEQAEEIAALLNDRNQLTVPYTGARVLKDRRNYLCKCSESGEVVACVEVKSVQWYQCEVLHLTVAKGHENQGHARTLLSEAEHVARERSARIIQCTIRDGNDRSRKLFETAGFLLVGIFFNETSGNNVAILQKVLMPAR